MAKIQTLKNKDDVIVYPQTHGTAVFVNEGELLQDKIEQYLTSEEIIDVDNIELFVETQNNKVTVIDDNATNVNYPSAKAVYDFVSNAGAGVKIEIYASKEAVAAPNGSTIYLIGAATPYEEYLYLEDTATWELIGNASVDLSSYYTKTEVDTNFAKKDKYGDIAISLGRREDTGSVGTNSVAIGDRTQANSNYSIAMGSLAQANASAAISLGRETRANGFYSVALGEGAIALGQGSVAAGRWNVENPTGELLYILGNGESANSRSNAHTIDEDGTAWFQGDIYVGSTSGTNKDEGSVKLAKTNEIPTNLSQLNNDKGYVSSATDSPNLVKYIWLGTQEEYDALASLDSNTEYNIIEEE